MGGGERTVLAWETGDECSAQDPSSGSTVISLFRSLRFPSNSLYPDHAFGSQFRFQSYCPISTSTIPVHGLGPAFIHNSHSGLALVSDYGNISNTHCLNFRLAFYSDLFRRRFRFRLPEPHLLTSGTSPTTYVLRGDHNVIIVDARRLKAGPWYLTAAENTWYIGRFVAHFIDYLVSSSVFDFNFPVPVPHLESVTESWYQYQIGPRTHEHRGLDLSKTHLVGHSLGAQSAGVAGGTLTSGKVARITGLDPALPLFDKLSDIQKLDASDAQFVDVIHTDAGIFGVQKSIGHADFYPNGGLSPQPGCELEIKPMEERSQTKSHEIPQRLGGSKSRHIATLE
ncbi:Lipase member H [Eumeta japonica]|uniref:Lipase member H n=1 Tax=Eumeta variegata TaxID=151549 RepID=A0A4C1WUZ2_EUMVA|nr:Lipase member H [Eumeta japonica]